MKRFKVTYKEVLTRSVIIEAEEESQVTSLWEELDEDTLSEGNLTEVSYEFEEVESECDWSKVK